MSKKIVVTRLRFVIALLFPLKLAFAQTVMSLPSALEHARQHDAIKVRLSPESSAAIASHIRRPDVPIYAEVSPIGDLQEPGCRRISVRLTSPGSRLELKDGGVADLDETFSLGICAEGKPPKNPYLIGK